MSGSGAEREIELTLNLPLPAREGPFAEDEYAAYTRRYDQLVAERLAPECAAGWEPAHAVDIESIVNAGRAVVGMRALIPTLLSAKIRLRRTGDRAEP